MKRDRVRARIEEFGILPAIRVNSAEDALFAAKAVTDGGIPIVELTMTIPDIFRLIAGLAASNSEMIVGVGTVLQIDDARRCVEAGASFLTSPGLDLEILEFTNSLDTVMIPGALTPTEVMAAHKAGGDFIKIFPCAQVGGPGYVRSLKAPFPHVSLIASGGVNQQTAADFIRAGAAALGIGEDLIPKEAIRTRNRDWIHELTRRFLGMVKDARARKTKHS